MVVPCLKKVLFLFMLSAKIVNATDRLTYNIMPSADDLRYFVNAIDNVVLYVQSNTTALHIPRFIFGLFLSNGKYNMITVYKYTIRNYNG